MQCSTCDSDNAAASRFCSHCGCSLCGSSFAAAPSPGRKAEPARKARCEACGQILPSAALRCPGCGYSLPEDGPRPADELFEQELYRRARAAFFRRLIERIERKSAEKSLYGVVRLLARRPIELDLAAALCDLSGVIAELAQPYVATLRRREVLAELSSFLAETGGAMQSRLELLDAASRAAGGELPDHPIEAAGRGALPCARRIWPGIGTCIGPAIEPAQLAGPPSPEAEPLLARLNAAYFDFVAAYDRLWLPVFGFVQAFVADRCRLEWQRLAAFDSDFRRYAALLARAKEEALAGRLDEALAAAREARSARPEEALAALVEGHLAYRLGRPAEALAAFEEAASLPLPFVGLQAERLYWSGRCRFDQGAYRAAADAFEALVALPRHQLEARYFLEGELLLARAYLHLRDGERAARHLLGAIVGGCSEVGALLDDPALAPLRGHPDLRATLRSASFLQALGRQAGIRPLGSTYLSRSAAPVRLAAAAGSWLDLGDHEDLVFFYDAGHTGSGRSGLCLTDRRVLWKEVAGRPRMVPLDRLEGLALRRGELQVQHELAIPGEVFDRLDALHALLSQVSRIYAG